ncbi:MAG: metallophosphoesterase family protein [Caldilineaceae bacterium]|nr:metallophosphoesterase family protein [Caldilineaceae bacterium]MCB9151955.1 metallophosphoesterase family protein [Caldilineaceae bacterium]
MRVLILSDIHANLVALESVLAAARQQYDIIWCLGDIVGYGPRPNECIELLRDQLDMCVMGNHDRAALGLPSVDVEDFNPHARRAVLWTREQLTESNRAYLAQLPDTPVCPEVANQFLLTHASPREPVLEYVLTPTIAMENFSVFDEPICLLGHTHKPVVYRWQLRPATERELSYTQADFVPDFLDEMTAKLADSPSQTERQPELYKVASVAQLLPQPGATLPLETSLEQRLIVNPGSVGQPRDNDARAAYAILDLEKMHWRYERIPYPIELTQSQMRAAKLPKRLIDRLSFGW